MKVQKWAASIRSFGTGKLLKALGVHKGVVLTDEPGTIPGPELAYFGGVYDIHSVFGYDDRENEFLGDLIVPPTLVRRFREKGRFVLRYLFRREHPKARHLGKSAVPLGGPPRFMDLTGTPGFRAPSAHPVGRQARCPG